LTKRPTDLFINGEGGVCDHIRGVFAHQNRKSRFQNRGLSGEVRILVLEGGQLPHASEEEGRSALARENVTEKSLGGEQNKSKGATGKR